MMFGNPSIAVADDIAVCSCFLVLAVMLVSVLGWRYADLQFEGVAVMACGCEPTMLCYFADGCVAFLEHGDACPDACVDEVFVWG
nr:hypothetical protein [Bifidobacterium aquikefiri]